MQSIFGPSFHYTPSALTNLQETFARIRREQRTVPVARAEGRSEFQVKALPIRPRRNTAGT